MRERPKCLGEFVYINLCI